MLAAELVALLLFLSPCLWLSMSLCPRPCMSIYLCLSISVYVYVHIHRCLLCGHVCVIPHLLFQNSFVSVATSILNVLIHKEKKKKTISNLNEKVSLPPRLLVPRFICRLSCWCHISRLWSWSQSCNTVSKLQFPVQELELEFSDGRRDGRKCESNNRNLSRCANITLSDD